MKDSPEPDDTCQETTTFPALNTSGTAVNRRRYRNRRNDMEPVDNEEVTRSNYASSSQKLYPSNNVPRKQKRDVPRRKPFESRRISLGTPSQEERAQPANEELNINKQRRRSRKKLPAAVGGSVIPTAAVKLSPPTYCTKCNAKKFANEPPHFCCGNGQIMENNPYAKIFRSLRELDIGEETKISLNCDSVPDQGLYNAPTTDEVAAIWLDTSTTLDTNSPHIVVHGKSKRSHRIMHYYGCYNPLQYPLLYPHGDCGWHKGLKKNCLYEAASNLPSFMSETSAPNENVEECLLAPTNGRLFQQFIVDMYVKIENTRLDYFRDHQKAIRADMYQGLTDSMGMGEHDASNVGRRVILPASFIGGPRDMHKRYLNAMAIVQKYGKPDLFVTMTCNPNWPEIKEELVAGKQVQNRPDLVARIFHAKLVELKKDIMDKKVFGPVAGMICVVEFQKRGLPHAHFLIILESDFKIKNPEDFDGYVSAEIPSTDSPHLRSAVLKHMMHGPCGNYNPNCSCMKQKDEKKVCKYGYPKKFVEATTSGSDSYPIYRRRDTQETVFVRRIQMDNRWVIPYNPYLLAKFDCHLNVEVCSTIKAVKYLYKYVYKGHDRIPFRLSTIDLANLNEIERYQAGRWVSPPEAAWRIFEFNLFEMHPTVLPLQLHLPNMQQVQFRENEDLADIVSDERRSRTMLTEFFKINSQRPVGPAYLYSEWPEHFVWDESTRCWKD